MSGPQNPQGWGYCGSFRSDQVPAAKAYAQQFAYVYDNGNGVYQYSDGVKWNQFGVNEFRLSTYRIGCIGASQTARNNPLYPCTNSTFSRTHVNGVGQGSVRVTSALDMVPSVGRRFRIYCDKYPQIEGSFNILTATAESGGTRLTYTDDREDVGPSAIPGAATIYFADPHFFTTMGGILTYASIASAGRARPVLFAVPNTNIVDDWNLSPGLQYNRVDEILALGPFGAIHVGGDLLLNALLAGYSSETIYASLVKLCNRLRGAAGRVFVEDFSNSRNVTYNSGSTLNGIVQGAIYTAGARLLRRMWRDLVTDCPNVQLVPVNMALTSGSLGSYSGAQNDLDNNWPLADNMDANGNDFAYGAARQVGNLIGEIWSDAFLGWQPEVSRFPDSVWNGTVSDTSSQPNNNIHSNWFDTVPTVAVSSTITGVAPQGCTLVLANPGLGAAGTSSVVTNPEGGFDWLVTYSETAGVAGPTSIVLQDAGYTGQEMWRKLVVSAGKTLDIYVPIFLTGIIDNTWRSIELALLVDYGSGLVPLCGGLVEMGTFTQLAGTKNLDTGFNGVAHFPEITIPADITQTTNAVIQLRLKAVGAIAKGANTQFGINAGIRVDVY